MTAVQGYSSVATIMNFLYLYYGPREITKTAGTEKGIFLNVIQKAARRFLSKRGLRTVREQVWAHAGGIIG